MGNHSTWKTLTSAFPTNVILDLLSIDMLLESFLLIQPATVFQIELS